MPSAPAPDWDDTPYVKVYLTLGRDHPAVWRDPRLLGGWVRALAAADRWWPSPAPMPMLPADIVAALEAEGVLEVDEDREWFTFHGLGAERAAQARRLNHQRAAGRARAAGAYRDPRGRLLGQPESSRNAQPAGESALEPSTGWVPAGHSNGSGPDPAGDPAGPNRLAPAAPAVYTTTPTTLKGGVVDSSPAPAPAREGRHDVDPCPVCNGPRRWQPGVGWVCPECSRAAGAREAEAGESFRSKVAGHGGWVPGSDAGVELEGERGRLLAERDRLLAQGADPADLEWLEDADRG